MGKPKSLLKKSQQKAPKNKPQPLRTADDFQEAADAEEETGGKWRAGDQAKSCRAFLRAIQIYNDGLQKHPKNFDLAYNKARLEFDLSQQPTLVPKLPMPLVELLQQALASHRYALSLNEENADILFNTAQVMISIAEFATDAGAQGDAIPLLREALEVLSACFSRQEMLLEQQKARFSEDANLEGGVPLESGNMQEAAPAPAQTSDEDADSETEEQSVSIQADITPEDLLDTARASVSALTLLISLEEPSSIPTLAQMAHTLTDTKIPFYLTQLASSSSPEETETTTAEVALERAEFIAALANADLRATTATPTDILSRFSIFESSFNLTSNVPAMCVYADALVELSNTLMSQIFDGSLQQQSPDLLASICWPQLTKAQNLYTAAIKANTDETKDRKAQIYESRGDVEMLRLRVATTIPPTLQSKTGEAILQLPASVVSSAPTLVKNAATFYRGACNLFRAEGNVNAARKAELRGLIATVLQGRAGTAAAAVAGGQQQQQQQEQQQAEMQAVAAIRQAGGEAAKVSVDMIREGLLPHDWDQGI